MIKFFRSKKFYKYSKIQKNIAFIIHKKKFNIDTYDILFSKKILRCLILIFS